MSKFNARTTADEVIKGHDLTNYECIVTGGTSGIGVETVRVLTKAGARVVIGARDIEKAEKVAKRIRDQTKNSKIEVEKLELDSLASVRNFVKAYLGRKRPLHLLINNAAIMANPLTYTIDGFESQFGTNHLGHFTLTLGLLPALKDAAKFSGRKSRVINLSSVAHAFSNVDFEDVNFKKRAYDPWAAYGQSKTANILFSVELTRLYANEGILSNAIMPGCIETGLQKYIRDDELKKFGWKDENGNINPNIKSVEQGASTTIWAAVADELNDRGGLYLEDCAISKLKKKEEIFQNMFAGGYTDYALDAEAAKKLWIFSLRWIESKNK